MYIKLAERLVVLQFSPPITCSENLIQANCPSHSSTLYQLLIRKLFDLTTNHLSIMIMPIRHPITTILRTLELLLIRESPIRIVIIVPNARAQPRGIDTPMAP